MLQQRVSKGDSERAGQAQGIVEMAQNRFLTGAARL